MKKEYSPLEKEINNLTKWESLQLSNKNKEKRYILEMFPYPSGNLHMGHVRNYSIGDVQARFLRMNGYDVMYPMGFDSFGLPAENAAIKNKVNPLEWTEKNIDHMREQLKRLGCSYNWDTEISTSRSSYYKWNQWIFKKLFDSGLIYRKKGYVNWDPVDKTVLANEQVIDGKGWRSGALVEKKEIEQWYIKITNYAEELLNDLDKLNDWPERVKNMQRQWIGKNSGTIIKFDVVLNEKAFKTIEVFTTRPDTLFGVTYLSIAPEHDQLADLLQHSPNKDECNIYIQNSLQKKDAERTDTSKTKTGVNTGLVAIHPITGDKVPLFIADYVLTDYGTGAVMAVPAHDERDHAFAQKFKLPLIEVIQAPEDHNINDSAYIGKGKLINSDNFSNENNDIAKKKISNYLVEIKKGEIKPQYKLRDWLISRQRYWGTPIPIVYDENGNSFCLEENELPVKLPTDISFDGTGNPIETSKTFKIVKRENKSFYRETDTMDTFFDSSWYFLRYCDPKNEALPFSKDIINHYCPIDYYIGGIEHACLHLLYSRFFTKALRDMGLHSVNEPFRKLICQGMVLKDGAKMSKSLGNTVDPNSIIEKYGADTARIFILFGAPVEKDLDWSDEGVDGSFRFLKRLFNYTVNYDQYIVSEGNELQLKKHCHKVIKKITEDINNFQFNTAISQIMELINTISKIGTNLETALIMAKLIAPFAPFIAEDIWENLNQSASIHEQEWPTYDSKLIIDNEITLVIQVNGKVRDKLITERESDEEMVKKLALEQQNISKHLENKTIIKTIFIPERLINFVVK